MSAREAVLRHHDLCFGCGQANLFGLQLEAAAVDGSVRGRFFVKQDHQGPGGDAHAGILFTALHEAMAFAGGQARALELRGSAPIGSFVELEATPQGATARVDGEVVAECRT